MAVPGPELDGSDEARFAVAVTEQAPGWNYSSFRMSATNHSNTDYWWWHFRNRCCTVCRGGLPFTWVEASHRLGGTWWKNHYPGVRLDTPTYGYSFSFAQRIDWPHQFAKGEEVLDYLETVIDRAGFRDLVQLNTSVESARWNEEENVWYVEIVDPLGNKNTHKFNAIITGMGQWATHSFLNGRARSFHRGSNALCRVGSALI